MSSLITSKLRKLKAIFTIPPMDESMAGVIIIYVFSNSVATSVWMFNAWTPFIYQLFGQSNYHVGLMSAVNGVFELMTAFVSGHLADKVWGPSRTLQLAVKFGLLTLCMVLVGIWTGQVWLLVLAQCFEGTYMGFSFTCVESVFAQCLRRGERDRLYSVKFSCEAAGPIVGVVLSAILYSIVGNKWDVNILRWVMTAGLLMHLTSMTTFLLTFKPLPWASDRKATDVAVESNELEEGEAAKELGSAAYDVEEPRMTVQHEEEELPPHSCRTALASQACGALLRAQGGAPPLTGQYDPPACSAACADHDHDNDDADAVSGVSNTTFFSAAPATTAGEEDTGSAVINTSNLSLREVTAAAAGLFTNNNSIDESKIPHGMVIKYVDVEAEEAVGLRKKMLQCLPIDYYPFLVALADIILVVGSGMTTQYFSLFMMTIYGVTPVLLSLLNLANSFVIMYMAIQSGILGKKYGRVRTMLPPKVIGAFILLWMALARETVYGPKVLMCIAYIFRNAFMNCSAGLSRALLMDVVPENRRGRWNAVESVQSAGWSGTAVLGGFFADNWGYGAAFIVTFFFHATACSLLAVLTVRNDSRLPRPTLVYEEVNGKQEACGDGKGGTVVAAMGITEKSVHSETSTATAHDTALSRVEEWRTS